MVIYQQIPIISTIASHILFNSAVIPESISTSTDTTKKSFPKKSLVLRSPRNCYKEFLKNIEMPPAKKYSAMTNLNNVKPKRLKIWCNHITNLGWH